MWGTNTPGPWLMLYNLVLEKSCIRDQTFKTSACSRGGGVKNWPNLPTDSSKKMPTYGDRGQKLWKFADVLTDDPLVTTWMVVILSTHFQRSVYKSTSKYCASNNKKVERAYSFMKCHTPNWNGRTFNVKFERILRLWELQAGQKSSHIVFTTTITYRVFKHF